jgi:hypothetical protein
LKKGGLRISILKGHRSRNGPIRFYSKNMLKILARNGPSTPTEIANQIANQEMNTKNERHYKRTKTILSRLTCKKSGVLKRLVEKEYVRINNLEPFNRDVVYPTIKCLLSVVYSDYKNREVESEYYLKFDYSRINSK